MEKKLKLLGDNNKIIKNNNLLENAEKECDGDITEEESSNGNKITHYK
jgi:hypothetical protein